MNRDTCDYNGRPISRGQKELTRLKRQDSSNSRSVALLSCGIGFIALANPATLWAAGDDAAKLEEVVVTSNRRAQAIIDHAGNVERLAVDELTDIRHQHLHELMNRVAGAWLSRGSGQKNLTAIRSPVLTGQILPSASTVIFRVAGENCLSNSPTLNNADDTTYSGGNNESLYSISE